MQKEELLVYIKDIPSFLGEKLFFICLLRLFDKVVKKGDIFCKLEKNKHLTFIFVFLKEK